MEYVVALDLLTAGLLGIWCNLDWLDVFVALGVVGRRHVVAVLGGVGLLYVVITIQDLTTRCGLTDSTRHK